MPDIKPPMVRGFDKLTMAHHDRLGVDLEIVLLWTLGRWQSNAIH